MPDHSDAARLIQTASRLREQGRFSDAAQLYEEVLRQAPQLATSWYNLGFCQRMSGKFEAALVSYQNAIDRGVSGPEEAHLNRAVILSDALRREAEAEAELRRALDLNPRYVPALVNLANLAEDRGRRGEAVGLYARALSIEPTAWEVMARHANALSAKKDVRAAIPRLTRALTQATPTDLERASLGFALGRVLDLSGDYDAAFAAYENANAMSRKAFQPRYDRTATEDLAARIIRVFHDVPPQTEGASQWSPIFICGMFRSGSTLAEQVLAGHPRVGACGEIYVLPQLVQEKASPFPERAAAFDAVGYADLARIYREKIEGLFPGADVVTDKWLSNFLYVGLIKRMFPAAKIVHTVREPLDNVLSVYFLHLDSSHGYATDLEDIAHQLRLSRRLMEHWRSLYPDDVVEFDYDAFVARPAETARNLLQRLNLGWDDEVLNFHRRKTAVRTASVWQVRQPLYTSSSGRWRNYASHLEGVRNRLADLVPSQSRPL